MDFNKIERTLREYRLHQDTRIVYPEGVPVVQKKTYMNIEQGRGYALLSFFTYLTGLGLTLTLNGVKVENVVEFGKELTELRRKANLSQIDILNASASSLTEARIINLEKGRGSIRKTLVSYLSVLPPIDFELIDKYGIYGN